MIFPEIRCMGSDSPLFYDGFKRGDEKNESGNSKFGKRIQKPKRNAWKVFKSQRYLYYMSIPFVIWVFIFQYLPLWGWTMAFQKYRPGLSF